MLSELGWARYITKEMFMMPKPQLQQAEALVILSDIKTNAQQQFSTKQMASKLATDSSSSAAPQRAGRTHHGRAHVLAPPPRATNMPVCGGKCMNE